MYTVYTFKCMVLANLRTGLSRTYVRGLGLYIPIYCTYILWGVWGCIYLYTVHIYCEGSGSIYTYILYIYTVRGLGLYIPIYCIYCIPYKVLANPMSRTDFSRTHVRGLGLGLRLWCVPVRSVSCSNWKRGLKWRSEDKNEDESAGSHGSVSCSNWKW